MHSKQKLVDVINFNSDASCLSSERWLKSLSGGRTSELFRILACYVEQRQKINLGFVGSTLSEVILLNPECIELINNYPNVFEIIYRPYIHSLSILWRDETFKRNFNLGRELTDRTFHNIVNWYLPPEFALRNSQLFTLANEEVGTFIHPKRTKKRPSSSLVEGYGHIVGIHNSKIAYLGFAEFFDKYYLDILQKYHSEISFEQKTIIGWRDGESPLLLPNSVSREEYFVDHSSQRFERIFLSDLNTSSDFQYENRIVSYPQNSLLPWMGGFRLYWYIQEVKDLERNFEKLSSLNKMLFMFLLNSDILSCTEKTDVQIEIVKHQGDSVVESIFLPRIEKNLDAEEILYLVKNVDNSLTLNAIKEKIGGDLSIRLNARIKSLKKLNSI